MKKIVVFLILLARFPPNSSTLRACKPNSRVLVDQKICQCNNEGQWTETNCQSGEQTCRPGQVVFQGCNRCICQENGHLSCNEESCANQQYQSIHESFTAILPWCNPFRTYYVNCNICVCPASGKTSEANCVVDVSCTLFKEPTSTEISSKLKTCIPKVMYLFPCMHCLCSDDGLLILDKCIETCAKKEVEPSRRCIPRTFYRRNCNVCRCPETSLPDGKFCTNATCIKRSSLTELRLLRSKSFNCTANHFTKPKCFFCDCNSDGSVDENSCLELDCLKSIDQKYNTLRETCSPGEVVVSCMECLCPAHGKTSEEYCTKTCSYQSKVQVLEKLLMTGQFNTKSNIPISNGEEKCKPNSIYFDRGKYCVCPDTGITNFNLCSAAKDNPIDDGHRTGQHKFTVNVTGPCEPNTLVDFDCNVCFCTKNGKIDPKWCTYDDCQAKRAIQLYVNRSHAESVAKLGNVCVPGSILKIDCNFCICSEKGYVDGTACTESVCHDVPPVPDERLLCEPMSYYEVDCNVCFCPRDGLKNLAKCTKNHCDKGYLRSTDCEPGQLFSKECNVCICSPNGNKSEGVCTRSECSDMAPWQKIFQLSQSLLGSQAVEDATRSLDLCFPGEEYVSGCKLCICPDMGLRYFADCSPSTCDDERSANNINAGISGSNRNVVLRRMPQSHNTPSDSMECETYNMTTSTKETECMPGSMYIIKCQQCICPYMGDLNSFCRKLPPEFHCERAYPGINFVPMSRRHTNETRHKHTRYQCDRRRSRKYTDACFVCECENDNIIAEHCFRNNAERCVNATPTFLSDD